MFGLNWPELMIISVVALIVIGPEDLPKMFRELGRFTAKLRQMSREFSRAMEQAAKETGVADVAKDLRSATSPGALGLDAVKQSMDKFEKWDPLKNAAKPTAKPLVPPPMPAPVVPGANSLTSVAERDAALEALPSVEDELAEDLADLEALDAIAPPAPAAAPNAAATAAHGPNTQALYDKAALRAQVLAEQTEKLKAIEAGTYAPPAAVPGLTRDLDASEPAAPKPAPKKRAAKASEAAPDAPKPDAAKADAPKGRAAKSASAEAAPKPKRAPRPKKAAEDQA